MINIRRGDLIALVSAVLVFIFSFLSQISVGSYHTSLWHRELLLHVFLIPLLALVVGALILLPILGNAVPTPLGIDAHRWTLIGSFLVAFSSVIWLISNENAGYGAVLMMIFALVLAAAAVATEYVSELRVPLTFNKPTSGSSASSSSAPAQDHAGHDHADHDHAGHDHASHEGHDHP